MANQNNEKHNSRAGIILILGGIILLLCALLLQQCNARRNEESAEYSQEGLELVEEEIRQRTERTVQENITEERPQEDITADEAPAGEEGAAEEAEPETAYPHSTEMPEVELDGVPYVGYLTIEALNQSWPVVSYCEELTLRRGPCRQFGSVVTDDMVIAGHNNAATFKLLYSLKPGMAVLFTDMNGVTNLYYVTEVVETGGNDLETIANSGHDLVLYTCTVGAKRRVVVMCDRPGED